MSCVMYGAGGGSEARRLWAGAMAMSSSAAAEFAEVLLVKSDLRQPQIETRRTAAAVRAVRGVQVEGR